MMILWSPAKYLRPNAYQQPYMWTRSVSGSALATASGTLSPFISRIFASAR